MPTKEGSTASDQSTIQVPAGGPAPAAAAGGKEQAKPKDVVSKMFTVLIRSRFIIVLAWFSIAMSLAYSATLFMTRTSMELNPPGKSPSGSAARVLREIFPSVIYGDPFVIMIENHRNVHTNTPLCGVIPGDSTVDYANYLRLANFSAALQDHLTTNYGAFLEKFLSPPDLLAKDLLVPAMQLCSNRTTAIIEALFLKRNGFNSLQVTRDVQQYAQDLFAEVFSAGASGAEGAEGDFRISFLGNTVLQSDILQSALQDMMRLDVISIPFGFVVIMCILRSFYLTLIPLLNLGLCFVINFGVSSIIAAYMNVPSFAPSVHSALMIAMTFDYSLFIFHRLLRDIHVNGVDPRLALFKTFYLSGHVIVVSGFSLGLVFMLMCFLPLDMIQMLGLTTALSVCILVLVSITNSIAWVCIFPNLFLKVSYDFAAGDYLNCDGCCDNPCIRMCLRISGRVPPRVLARVAAAFRGLRKQRATRRGAAPALSGERAALLPDGAQGGDSAGATAADEASHTCSITRLDTTEDTPGNAATDPRKGPPTGAPTDGPAGPLADETENMCPDRAEVRMISDSSRKLADDKDPDEPAPSPEPAGEPAVEPAGEPDRRLTREPTREITRASTRESGRELTKDSTRTFTRDSARDSARESIGESAREPARGSVTQLDSFREAMEPIVIAKQRQESCCVQRLRRWRGREARPYFLLDLMSKSKYLSILIIGVLIGAGCAFAVPLFDFRYSINLTMMLPVASESVQAIRRFSSLFSAGMTNQVFVVFNKTGAVLPAGGGPGGGPGAPLNTLLNEETYRLMFTMTRTIVAHSKEALANGSSHLALNGETDVISPTYLGGLYIDSELSRHMLNANDTIARTYQFIMAQCAPQLNNLNVVALVLMPNISTTGEGADVFVPFLRREVGAFRGPFRELGVDISVYSLSDSMIDSITGLYGAFPLMVATTAVAIFLVMVVSYQSILTPLRLFLEVFVTITVVCGSLVVLFQYLHCDDCEGVFWIVPIIAFSICVGLNTDYDVFIFSMIDDSYLTELKSGSDYGGHGLLNFLRTFRRKHPNNGAMRRCILTGSENTYIVMLAGLLMIISFAGICMSSLRVLTQFGTAIVLDVFLDAFVVVPIVVPGSTFVFGELQFWPKSLFIRRRLLCYRNLEFGKVSGSYRRTRAPMVDKAVDTADLLFAGSTDNTQGYSIHCSVYFSAKEVSAREMSYGLRDGPSGV